MANATHQKWHRLLSAVLVVVMLLSLLPTTIAAEQEDPEQKAAEYVVLVKDQDTDKGIPEAVIEYTVLVDGEAAGEAASVTTDKDGKAVISGLADCADALEEGKTVALEYAVSAEDYASQEKKIQTIESVEGELAVTLVSTIAVLTLKQEGDGAVKVNGSSEFPMQVTRGESVKVEVTPGEKGFIKSVKIDGAVQTVEDRTSFSTEYTFNADSEIEVAFGKYCDVHASISNGQGTIMFGEQTLGEDPVTVESGTKASLIVTPEKEQIISAITINGAEQKITEENEKEFSQEITVEKDTEIVVSFVPVTYKVVIQYNKDGTVTTTPEIQVVEDDVECVAGTVGVETGKTLTLKAVPNEHFRVKQVQINGVTSDKIEGKNGESFEDTFKITEDTTFVVTFAPDQYTVSFADDLEHVSGEVQGAGVVDHGASIGADLEVEDGYGVREITFTDPDGNPVEGVEYTTDAGVYAFLIKNVTQDLVIHVTTEKLEPVAIDQIVIDETNVVNKNVRSDKIVYVLKQNSSLTITAKDRTEHEYISIEGNNRTGFSRRATYSNNGENAFIGSIALSYVRGIWLDWMPINIPSNGIDVIVDNQKPALELTVPALPNGLTQYRDNVTVQVKAEEPLARNKLNQPVENGYSGVSKIEYWITSDGKATAGSAAEPLLLFQASTLNPNPKDASGTFTVNARTNNSDKVVVNVKVTDLAGNTETKQLNLKINAVRPSVSVHVDGEQAAEAVENYYNTVRTAEVTVSDRASSFDKNRVTFYSIDADGNEKGLDARVRWSGQTATVEFEKEGAYKWGVRYENNAGSTCEGAADESSTHPFDFIFDKTAPAQNVKMTVDGNPVAGILEKITFGLFRQAEAAVSVDRDPATDDASPVKPTLYYKDSGYATENGHKDLTVGQLNDAFAAGKFGEETLTVSPDDAAVVYARIVDYAGNVTYLNTNGIIVDTTKPLIELKPDEPNEFGFYNKEVNVAVNVYEAKDAPAAYSGLKSVTWRLYIKDAQGNETQETKGDFNKQISQAHGSAPYSGLQRVLEESVTISKDKYNSDSVWLEVTATDNAGNAYTTECGPLAINSKDPTLALSFDVNEEAKTNGVQEGYFNQVRTATITIVDRPSTFREENLVINLNKAEHADKSVVYTLEDLKANMSWTHSGDTHIAKIQFLGDAIYDWNFSYTNLAGRSAKAPDVSKVHCPYQFTVDLNAPAECKIDVKAKDPDNFFEAAWNFITWVISFGTYTPKSAVEATITAQDDTSRPVLIEYYKTDTPIEAESDTELIQELDKLYSQNKFDKYENPIEVAPEENGDNVQAIIYVRITDAAGNRAYVNSDGIIVDANPSEITPADPNQPVETVDPEDPSQPTEPSENPVESYNEPKEGDQIIEVPLTVSESTPTSGIKLVTYQVFRRYNQEDKPVMTQSGTLYSNLDKQDGNPRHKDVTVQVKAKDENPALDNDACFVDVYVTTTDHAGNVRTVRVPLDIDVTAPTIAVKFDNHVNPNANPDSNVYTDRTATVTITERDHHFDPEAATKGIQVTAKDAAGKKVELSKEDFSISEWKLVAAQPTADDPNTTDVDESAPANPNFDQHVATVTFKGDARYTFDISYTDAKGNANEGVSYSGSNCNAFTVDNTAPNATLTVESREGRKQETKDVVSEDTRTFGFWSIKGIDVTSAQSDDTSAVYTVEYYKTVAKNAKDASVWLTEADLKALPADSWTAFPAEGLSVTDNQQFVVYLKVMDDGGNVRYLSTNGMIVDNQHPIDEMVAPTISVTKQEPINGIYKESFNVDIKVDDPLVGGTYSGLKEVRYAVFDRASATPNKATQEGVLFTNPYPDPKQDQIQQEYTGSITVDAEKNNSNDVQIVIYAVDNAGNTRDNAQENSVHAKVDTTAPVIKASYNNNSADSGTFFKAARTLTVEITERNFRAEDVKLTVTKDGQPVTVSPNWSERAGRTPNKDDTVHIAAIPFTADGDYTFDIAYTDLAGNKAAPVEFANGTVAAKAFTVDNIDPRVTVSYDNTSAQNGNYYKAARTATIVINEHNFDPGRVAISLAATDDGAGAAAPAVSTWRSNGDTHTATISYSNDARYTFDIKVTDKAGRVFDGYNEDVFFVDKTAPKLEITGVENNSANRDDIIPVVTYSDTNWDANLAKITLVGATRGDVKLDGGYQDIHNGRRFVFKNFPVEKDVDDIYTLTASLTDKAGNTTTQTIRFSANRFGSAYEMSKETKALNGTYVRHADDVVMTEVNPDELKNIKLTLFKNNKSTVLKEGRDYSMVQSGGNGEWFKYVYTVFNKNFEEGGVYRITFHSEDAAGNVAENTLETKGAELGFGIDQVEPTVSILNLESKKTYNLEKMTVNMTANDDLKLDSVVIYLDGQEYIKLTEDELDELVRSGGNYSFDINGDSTDSHELQVVATDAAGNQYVETVEDFYVTTNLWVRYRNNKPLFFGSIIGALVIAASWIFFIVAKRRKEDEEEEQTKAAG